MQIVYFYDTYYHYAGFPIVTGRGVGPLCSPIMLILPPCNGLPLPYILTYAPYSTHQIETPPSLDSPFMH